MIHAFSPLPHLAAHVPPAALAASALTGSPLPVLLSLHDAFTGVGGAASPHHCPSSAPPSPGAAFGRSLALAGAGYALGRASSGLPFGAAFGPIVGLGLPLALAQGLGQMLGRTGGAGSGSLNPNAMPGQINGTNPLQEYRHQAEIDGVLNDPSLSVEDKVTLMLMMIMNKMDKDIERQAQYINSVQQQQSNRDGAGQALGVAGTVGGAVAGSVFPGVGTAVGAGLGGMLGNAAGSMVQNGGDAPSIDVEATKLKRMIDKRSQMFDMLRQIIDKYNETAKGMIQSIGR